MAVLKELVRNIVVIVMLTTILDMFLPSSTMRSYIKMVMGLFILVSILNPILNLILKNQDLEVFAWQQPNIASAIPIQLESERINAVNQEIFLKNYAARIEVQMQVLVQLVKGVETAELKVELIGGKKVGMLEGIKNVVITVNKKGEGGQKTDQEGIAPVKIEIKGQETIRQVPEKNKNIDNKIIEREIKSVLSRYFGLEPRQIKVVFP